MSRPCRVKLLLFFSLCASRSIRWRVASQLLNFWSSSVHNFFSARIDVWMGRDVHNAHVMQASCMCQPATISLKKIYYHLSSYSVWRMISIWAMPRHKHPTRSPTPPKWCDDVKYGAKMNKNNEIRYRDASASAIFIQLIHVGRTARHLQNETNRRRWRWWRQQKICLWNVNEVKIYIYLLRDERVFGILVQRRP